MAKLTKEEFTTGILDTAGKMRKLNPQWRKGQAVFNAVDYNVTYMPIARIVQLQCHIDCFYLDEKIDAFIDKCYEIYSENYDKINTL